ncbi:MAG: autotransporter outer membrane beta-barrel domain-containing protein, partial [Succinivibrio sp.]
VSSGAKIVLAGNTLTRKDAEGLKIFADVADSANLVENPGNFDVTITFASGLYKDARVEADGTLANIGVDYDNIRATLTEASDPIKSLVFYIAENGSESDGAGTAYILNNAMSTSGRDVENTARLGIYSGAFGIASQVASISSDTALARNGIGTDRSASVKGEKVNIYTQAYFKHSRSSSLKAQGVSYGNDTDMTSLILGSDFKASDTLNTGFYANLGQGKSDGRKQTKAIDNSFEYYGLGLYAGFDAAENLKLVADMSYSVTDNEINQSASGLSLNADAKLKSLSFALTSMYSITTDFAKFKPYAGIRYLGYDLDDYSVNSALGTIANNSSDTIKVYSVPVGLAAEKEISKGEWDIKAGVDGRISFNLGDRDCSSKSTFVGSITTALSTEVFDSVTYGVGGKLSAEKGELAVGMSVDYKGSSKTRDMGASFSLGYRF